MPPFKWKKLWFDEKRVFRMTDRKTRRSLNRFGGTVRKHAQFSMRSRKGSAPSGSPPYAHGRKLLKRLLFYAFDPSSKSVVVGPVRLDETKDLHVPKVLEQGGVEVGRDDRPWKKWDKTLHVKRYQPSHFMGDAARPYYGQIAKWYAES